MGDVEIMNKEQEGLVGSGNAECKMSKKPNIRYKKVTDFNNWTLPKGLQQLIENLNDKQKEVIKEISFDSLLHLQVDMILGRLAVAQL